MTKYYVNDNTDNQGNHEVHKEGCSWLKLVVSSTYLGEFSSCKDAVAAAKKIYSTADGDIHCIPECNNG
ncbi:hypothetical protein J2128_001343 [Methanomicrobium sp. W14]|uniref:hypothetical protein n=1 Tax=Methanomicrobium sp. W14 TaxID=2817839 RepID=UPI001AE39858|nr:hypothetical protein [Methanomicrobium sp. W14]MBP2133389.1 hypothetical protein [Methanomicrobium sp. W14]